MKEKLLIFIGLAVLLSGSYLVKTKTIDPRGSLRETTEFKSGCEDFEGDDIKMKQCWDNLILDTAQTKGVGYSMQMLTNLYSNPKFAKECHNFSHTIGGEAYIEFKKNNKIDISPAMNFCGFGFYHGFMEMLFAKGGNIQVARDLCNYMDKQTNSPEPYAYGACFHGIGHGVVDGSNKKDWGNAQALIDPGLKLCEQVAITDEEHYRCYSGAFNSISIAYTSRQYGLKVDPENPLKFCKEQKEKYKLSCYADVAVIIMNETSHNLEKAIKLISPIVENEYAIMAMKNVAGLRARTFTTENNTTDSLKEIVKICKSGEDRIVTACIRGFGAGLVEFGPPNKEHIRSFEFCGNSLLNEEEKGACYRDVFNILSGSKTREYLNRICGTLEEKYRNMCQNNNS